jgi:hypothetical protein
MDFPLDLTPPQAQALAEAALRLRVRPEELAAAAVRDLLARPAPEFDQAARLILEKNAELYRRLA